MAARNRLILLPLALALASPIQADDARFATTGSEFQVNTTTSGDQGRPVVAMADNGDFVVVWASTTSSGADASGSSILGQRYASDGLALGSEFEVNTFTTGDQIRPAVGIASSGDFVVVWESAVAGVDPDGSIQAQRFASDGSWLSTQFQVNSFTTTLQSNPSVGVAADGDFVVVWESGGSVDGASTSIQGQRYASDGTALGGEIQVNSYTTDAQSRPAVAVAGDFVVVWQSYGSPGADGDATSVQGQRYAADGTPLGGQFQVNTYSSGYQDAARVAVGSSGFVVAWQSEGSPGTDGTGYSVQARRYASDGTALGAQFQVNTFTSSYETDPAVAIDAAGNFTVVWQSGGSFFVTNGPDGDEIGIVGQRYAADGSSLGGELVINSYTTSNQELPHLAMTPGGDFVVAWESEGSGGSDASGFSIQAQRYTFAADLSITKSDGVDSASPGGTVIYTIVAANGGPDAAAPVEVSDVFPVDLTCSWTSVAAGGATGNTVSAGDLADVLTMPAGSSVTYTVTCDIDAEANVLLVNTATISSAVNDPDPSNNSATDSTAVPAELFTDGFELGNTAAWSNTVG